MPATSPSQQRLFGMVHAYQQGKLPKGKASRQIKRMARDIDPESVNHFAKTKHKDMPKKEELKKAAELGLLQYRLRKGLKHNGLF